MERKSYVIGPRTRKDILEGKVIRKHKDGADVFEDYFTDSEDDSSSKISDESSTHSVNFQTKKSSNLAEVSRDKSPVKKNVQSLTIIKSYSKVSFHSSINANGRNMNEEACATNAEDITVNTGIENSPGISNSDTNLESHDETDLSSNLSTIPSSISLESLVVGNSLSLPYNKKKELPRRTFKMSFRKFKKSISRSTKNAAEIRELQSKYDEYDEKIMQMVNMDNNSNNIRSVASDEELSMSQKLPSIENMGLPSKEKVGKASKNSKFKENIPQNRKSSSKKSIGKKINTRSASQLKESPCKMFVSKENFTSKSNCNEKDIPLNSDKGDSYSDSQVNSETEINACETQSSEWTTLDDSHSASSNCLETPVKFPKSANNISKDLQTKNVKKRNRRSRGAVEVNSSNINGIRNVTNSTIDDIPVTNASASQAIATKGEKSTTKSGFIPDKNNKTVRFDISCEIQNNKKQSLIPKNRDLLNTSTSSENSVNNASESNAKTSKQRTATMKKSFTLLDNDNLGKSDSNFKNAPKENITNTSFISAENSGSVSELNLKSALKKRKKIQNAISTDDSDNLSRLQTSDNKQTSSITRGSYVLRSNNAANGSMNISNEILKRSEKLKKNKNIHNTAANGSMNISNEILKRSEKLKKNKNIHNTATNENLNEPGENLEEAEDEPDESFKEADENLEVDHDLSVRKSKSSSPKNSKKIRKIEDEPDENLEVDHDLLSVRKSKSSSPKTSKKIAHTEANHAVRRSKRQRFAPFARWRNERLLYRFENGNINIIGVDKGTKEDTAFTQQLFKYVYSRQKKEDIRKPKKAKIFDIVNNREQCLTLHKKFPLIPWNLPINAQKNKDFDNGFLMKRMFDTNKNSFGFLQINAGKTKPTQYMPDEDLQLTVVKGKLEIRVHNDVFIITTNDMFIVPHGTAYSITNVGNNKALLSYAVGKFRFK